MAALQALPSAATVINLGLKYCGPRSRRAASCAVLQPRLDAGFAAAATGLALLFASGQSAGRACVRHGWTAFALQ
jgi:hypothetical protein